LLCPSVGKKNVIPTPLNLSLSFFIFLLKKCLVFHLFFHHWIQFSVCFFCCCFFSFFIFEKVFLVFHLFFSSFLLFFLEQLSWFTLP
jgi:hypothetical protein